MKTIITISVAALAFLSLGALAEAKCTPNDPFEQEGCLEPKPAPIGERLQCSEGAKYPPIFIIHENVPQAGLATIKHASGETSTVNFEQKKERVPTILGWDIRITKTHSHPYFETKITGHHPEYEPLPLFYNGTISTEQNEISRIHCKVIQK